MYLLKFDGAPQSSFKHNQEARMHKRVRDPGQWEVALYM